MAAGGAEDGTLKSILAHELQLRDRNSMLSVPNRNLSKALALLNNVICYTFAPIAMFAHRYYHGHSDVGHLIVIFFITFVVFAFPSSWIIERYGLRAGVVLGGWLQMIGAGLRCFGGQWMPSLEFHAVVLGQVRTGCLRVGYFHTPLVCR